MKHATLETSPVRGHRQFGTGGVFHLWHLDTATTPPADPPAPVRTVAPVAVAPDPVTEAVPTTATQTSLF